MVPAVVGQTSVDPAQEQSSRQPPPGADDPLDVVEVAAAVLVRNLELLRRRGDAYAELDRAEYLLLRTLDRTGPLDICTLAAALGLDPSTAGRQVAAMQRGGLVDRDPAPTDRRRSIIGPTAKGRSLMAKVRQRRRQAAAELLEDWSQDEIRLLARMFTRYNHTVAQRYLQPEPAKTEPTAPPVAVQVLLPT